MRKIRINLFLSKTIAVTLIFLTLLITCTLPMFAENEEVDAIAITVIVPPVPERPAPATVSKRLFPINVAEGYNYDGVRELVRIYELLPHESPEWIDTESFSRNGYYYQIAEITRQVGIDHTVREHTEIIEIPSSTNDLAAVVAGLDPTMDFIDDDGYVGVLHLDIRSIEMTQDGTRSTSRTVTEVREYPHLSNADLALIPQTLTANGRTYTLDNVDWRTNTSNAIDFNSVPQSYTARATYSRTATSTVSTGYTTKAVYSGTLTRVSTGDVRFVASFLGTPIVSPIVNRPVQNPELETEPQDDVDNSKADTVVETPITENDKPLCDPADNEGDGSNNEPFNPNPETDQPETVQKQEDEQESGGMPVIFILLGLAVASIISVLLFLMFRYKKKADAYIGLFHKDNADALYSRMSSIVKRDRKEFAALIDDESDDENEDIEMVDVIEDEED